MLIGLFSPTPEQVPFYDRLPGLCAPADPRSMTTAAAVGTAGSIYACRVVVPISGVLHDLANYHTVVSGNFRLGIMDTGLASAGNRSLLWESGSVAVGAEGWQVAGDPALAVTAGEALDFVLMADNTTATFGRSVTIASPQGKLPANYLPVAGGASPKVGWVYAAGAYAAFPATVSEANCGTSSGLAIPFIMGRIAVS